MATIYDEPLKWGETYFDRMTHEELLLHAKRMYSALRAADSVVSQAKWTDERFHQGGSAYWGKGGVGGAANEKINQAIDAILRKDDDYSEQMYRAYFRYADDLLFDHNGYRMVGSEWYICENGDMLARDPGVSIETCSLCGKPMRPIQWSDLAIKD